MSKRQSFSGTLALQITSADSVSLLNCLSENRVHLREITYCGPLDMQVSINKKDYKKIIEISKKQGANIQILKQSGIGLLGSYIQNRPVLLALFCLLLFITVFLPSRVLFVYVEGNSTVPSKQIIEAANNCGIGFGTQRRQIRSEVMKNALLQEIPQLKWAGINTLGCTAVISVQERTLQELADTQQNKVSSIVAVRDGIIQDCTVYKGNPLCSVGQAVKAGQTLVSGYLDCGIITKATGADAEINAVTFRELEIVSPASTQTRGDLQSVKTKYSLQIGKFLLNLSKDSGNLDTSCVKIYTQRYLTLPGGFQLPIAIIKERCYSYQEDQQKSTAADDAGWLYQFAQSYLKSTMISGQIISQQGEISADTDGCYLSGKYACLEMIGQVKYEQTMIKDEMYD